MSEERDAGGVADRPHVVPRPAALIDRDRPALVQLHPQRLEKVGHALWTFTIPKLLRPYFLHHRELLGELCRASWEVVREIMVAAAQRPGMVAVVHMAGDLLGWHPHVHAVASRGGWDADGEWVPVPFVGTPAAERLFQHLVIALLRAWGY